MEVRNKYVTIKAHIDGALQESDFKIKTDPFSLLLNPGSRDIIIKNLYVSIDPYQINRMKTASASQNALEFLGAIAPGEVIIAYGVGKVVASGNPEFEKDDYVVGLISWGEYTIWLHSKEIGPNGLTIIIRCWAFRYFPDGIDIYFDNVGGEMLEAAILNMKLHGRVIVCGVISEYTNIKKRASPDMLNVIYKSITIQGFLASDYLSFFPEFVSTITNHMRMGKMHVLEDISVGLESVPSAFVGLFRGDNVGKKIVHISDE